MPSRQHSSSSEEARETLRRSSESCSPEEAWRAFAPCRPFCSCFAAAMRAGVLRARTFGPGVRVARARVFAACEEEALFALRGELELPVRCPGLTEFLSFVSM